MMRGFYAGMLASILAVAPAVEAVASFRVTHLYGFGAGGTSVFSVVDQGEASGDTITVSNVNFGSPDPNRWIIVVVTARAGGSSTFTYSAASDQINGSNATTYASTNTDSSGDEECAAGLFAANVTSGGTGSFRVVLSRSAGIDYVVFRLITASGGSTTGTNSDEDAPNHNNLQLSVNTVVGDVVVAGGTFQVSSGTRSATGITEVRNDGRELFGYHIATTAETPRTVTISNTVATDEACGVAASFNVS